MNWSRVHLIDFSPLTLFPRLLNIGEVSRGLIQIKRKRFGGMFTHRAINENLAYLLVALEYVAVSSKFTTDLIVLV